MQGRKVREIREITGGEMASALEALAVMARRGELRSLAFGIETSESDYRIGLLGGFRRRPIEAVGIAARMTAVANSLLTVRLQEADAARDGRLNTGNPKKSKNF